MSTIEPVQPTPSVSPTKNKAAAIGDSPENSDNDEDVLELFSPRSNAPLLVRFSKSQEMSMDNPFSPGDNDAIEPVRINDHHGKENAVRNRYIEMGVEPKSLDRIEAWIRAYRIRQKLALSDFARYRLMQIKDLSKSVHNGMDPTDPRIAWFSAIKRSLAKTKEELVSFLENGEAIVESDRLRDWDTVVYQSLDTQLGQLIPNIPWIANLKESPKSTRSSGALFEELRARKDKLRKNNSQPKRDVVQMRKRPNPSKRLSSSKSNALSKLEALNAGKELKNRQAPSTQFKMKIQETLEDENTDTEIIESAELDTYASQILGVDLKDVPRPQTSKAIALSETKDNSKKGAEEDDVMLETQPESKGKFSYLRRKSKSMRPQQISWKNVRSRVECKLNTPREKKRSHTRNRSQPNFVNKNPDFSRVRPRIDTGRKQCTASDTSDVSSTNSESSASGTSRKVPSTQSSPPKKPKRMFQPTPQEKITNIQRKSVLPQLESLIEKDTARTKEFLVLFSQKDGSSAVPQIEFGGPLFNSISFEQYSNLKKKLLSSGSNPNHLSFLRSGS